MRTALLALAVAAAALTAAGCSSSPTSTPATPVATPPPATTAASAASETGGPSGLGPGKEICSIASGGTYYLNVTSKTANDLKACDAGTPFKGGIDQLLALPNMDRRCFLPMTGQYSDADVAVYSDTKSADLSAAKSLCTANGGTN